jgi:hypothetical protein
MMLLSTYNCGLNNDERILNKERETIISNIDKASRDLKKIDEQIFELSKTIENCDNRTTGFSDNNYLLKYKIFQINETFNLNKINIECFTPNKYINPYFPIYQRFQNAFNLSRNKEIKIVFHGTDKRNIDIIMREGLDPARRTRQAYGPGEYFGKDVKTSLGYCKGGNIVLVFAILYEKDGITIDGDILKHNPGEKMLVINKIEYQLPIGYVIL